MRITPIAFLTILCGALLAALWLSYRFFHKEVPGAVAAYLVAILCCHFLTLVGAILGDDFTNSRTYQNAFFLLLMISAALGILVAAKLSEVHPWWLTTLAAFFGIAFQTAVYLTFQFHLAADYGGPLHKATKLCLLDGVLHAALGAIVLLTLAANVTTISGYHRFCIGLYMTLRGAWGLAFASGAIRNRADWEARNEWLPMMPGIISFGLLVIFLAFAQRELSHQESPAAAIHAEQVLATQEVEQ